MMDVDEDEIEEEEVDEDSSEGYSPSSSEPSWANKLKNKMKALFCMQAKPRGSTGPMLLPRRVAAATRDLEDVWRGHIQWIREAHHSRGRMDGEAGLQVD